MDTETLHIDKKFWEDKHGVSDRYWLTGSSLKEIMALHDISYDELTNKDVLEIGVGLGNLSHDVVKYTDKLICCDISETALSNVSDMVSEKHLTSQLNKIKPVDLAICHLVFQHCTNEEIKRIINDVVLKDGGIFTFQFAFLRDGEEPNNKVKDLINLGSHHFRGIDEIKKMVEGANKEIVWTSEPIHYHDAENFSWFMVKIKNKK
jgi:SAM-dependent methyltransferase